MPIRSLLMVVLAVSLLQGCGFHLRGKVDLPAALSVVYVKVKGFPALESELKDALRENGVEVMPSPSESSSTVDLFKVLFERQVRTVDTRGKTTGYVLNYTVNFSVEDAGGELLLDRGVVRLRRNFDFDSTQVLQAEEEEAFLREDMEQEIALQILRRLSFIAAAPSRIVVAGASTI